MIDYLEMLREFHNKYDHYQGKLGTMPPTEIIELREKLITEEATEFSGATFDFQVTNGKIEHLTLIADALADILYVTFGAAITYGIPIEDIFLEVHRSNMTKSMEKDTKSIKGKTIKGPNWESPNIEKIIREKMNVDD